MTDHYEIYMRRVDNAVAPDADLPHTHTYHEIFMMIEGSVDYLVEGTVFPLRAGDVVIASAGDPHSKYVNSSGRLQFFVLNVEKDFFTENGCEEYEKIFNSGRPTDHKINGKDAERSGLYDVYRKIRKYTSDFSDCYSTVAKCAVTEFLYLLGKNSFSENFIENPHIRRIVELINAGFAQSISLDTIAERTFLSKYYVCKLFKEHTGMTVKEYITQKRLTNVKRLIKEGYGITDACMRSGFPDYSSFYNAWRREYGTSPRETLGL